MNFDELQDFWPIIALAFYLLVYKGYELYRCYQERSYYQRSAYYLITQNPYSSLMYHDGRYLEYLTYEYLKYFENSGGKFLFNLIIPKINGGTTEIDVLLICSKGLLVFECKDFGGWIFGHESQKYWTQTLPSSLRYHNKERFYNPIMQNASHIKHLRHIVREKAAIFSIIVFSDRCTLMDINIRDTNIPVINISEIRDVVSLICEGTKLDAFTVIEINDIYNKLHTYTQHTYQARASHALDIRRSFRRL